MNAQGIIAESIISFKITWDNLGKGQQPKWDQNKQSIEIHETDVYPDLNYTAAYAAPLYVKYTSGSLLNDLLVEINKVIDSKLANANEAELPAGPNPKALPAGSNQLGLPAAQKPKELMSGGEIAQSLITAPVRGGDLVKPDEPKSDNNIDTKPEVQSEPDVKPEEKTDDSYAYTVTVYGDKLRFLEGQEERGAYSAGVKFLYKVSNNLTKTVAEDRIDNKPKIWAEVRTRGLAGRTIKLEFQEFDETEFKFGGNLLAQVLPSVELSFTPSQDSVYSKEKPELDIADVIKATNITLGSKTTTEIKALQKQIQKEIESRESQLQGDSGKQSDSDKNK